MAEHRFGGEWTAYKLEILRHYLAQYRLIFEKSPNAKYFRTIYVDAYAGSGDRVDSKVSNDLTDLIGDPHDADRVSYQKGSARIALELASPFDRYLFIEKQHGRSAELEEMIGRDFPHLSDRCSVVQDESNRYIQRWVKQYNWREWRAVVFLDPYGMAVEWSTIEATAKTRAIDLWVLFPVGAGVNRLLKRGGPPPPEWEARLTSIFGTDAWKERFYAPSPQADLFGADSALMKDASFDGIGSFFIERLRGVFSGVAERAAHLENSKRVPLYWLCFAAGNPRGAPIAVRIASYLINPDGVRARPT